MIYIAKATKKTKKGTVLLSVAGPDNAELVRQAEEELRGLEGELILEIFSFNDLADLEAYMDILKMHMYNYKLSKEPFIHRTGNQVSSTSKYKNMATKIILTKKKVR